MANPIRTFRHFRDVPDGLWRWDNFSPAEIACRGTGQLKLHPEALDRLQALRDRLGKPLILRSAYRSPAHNKAVKGAPHSKHMDGTAFDIAMSNHDPVAFEAAAREVGFLGFGFYPRSGFIHIDLGPARSWGERFPVRGGGRSSDGGGRWRRSRAGGPDRGAGRRPAAGPVPRHAPLAVHLPRAGRDRAGRLGAARRLAQGPALMWASLLAGILSRPWARQVAGLVLVVLTIILFMINFRRTAERAGRAAERLETLERTNAIHHQMLDAAARRPRSRDDLLDRLRGGQF